MRKLWMAFWTLSKGERIGVSLLLALLGLHLSIDAWLPAKEAGPVALDAELAAFLQQEALLLAGASPGTSEEAPAVELFPFNINTIDSAGMRTLGLSSRSISGLLRFRNKGGQIRDIAAFDKLFSLTDAEKDRLRPWLRFEGQEPAEQNAFPANIRKAPTTWQAIALNQADSLSLLEVPGIGPAFAGRIIRYRERLGGFSQLQQLREVYGIDSVRYEALAPLFQLETTSLKPLYLNQAEELQLAGHPYIGKVLARRLVAYRQQHGPFKKPEDLLRIHGLDTLRFQKLLPYLQLEGLQPAD
ncbi:MAG: helix-hairpin-helix domain-containing protein [Sphingobacteriaceae bacterium]|nr:helix-hairpin-helix domain-containing protein [Sphingobacteriaceae bacterium]